MGMALLAFFILRSASLHLLSIWLRKLYRRVAPNSTANFCISSEIIGLHSCIESDRFSTSVLSLYTLSFRLTSSFALISSNCFSSSRYSFLGVAFMASAYSFPRKNRISFSCSVSWAYRFNPVFSFFPNERLAA